MFSIFKRKSEKERLNEQYKKYLKEAYLLSSTNRSASDAKVKEANAILEKIDKILE